MRVEERRRLAALVFLSLTAAACSDDGDEIVGLEPIETTEATASEATATSTTDSATALPEQAQAEAEVAQLVTDFWLTEVDTSKGVLGLEFMTGLVETRTQEWATGLASKNEGLRDFEGQKRIQITKAQIDLNAGTGEVEACMGSGSELIDLDTLEQIGIGSDPDFLSTSVIIVLDTPAGWKISEIRPSILAGAAELCEFGDAPTTTSQ